MSRAVDNRVACAGKSIRRKSSRSHCNAYKCHEKLPSRLRDVVECSGRRKDHHCCELWRPNTSMSHRFDSMKISLEFSQLVWQAIYCQRMLNWARYVIQFLPHSKYHSHRNCFHRVAFHCMTLTFAYFPIPRASRLVFQWHDSPARWYSRKKLLMFLSCLLLLVWGMIRLKFLK